MDAKISDIMKTTGDMFTFVTVTDSAGKQPIGLLFISDLAKVKSKADLITVTQTLKDF